MQDTVIMRFEESIWAKRLHAPNRNKPVRVPAKLFRTARTSMANKVHRDQSATIARKVYRVDHGRVQAEDKVGRKFSLRHGYSSFRVPFDAWRALMGIQKS
jgi:hypothetical protein